MDDQPGREDGGGQSDNEDGVTITKAFILENGGILSEEEMAKQGADALDTTSDFYKKFRKGQMAKSMPGSSQKMAKDPTAEINAQDEVEPRYDPEMLAMFLEAEAIHFRCVATKTSDSVKRAYQLEKDTESGVDDATFDDEKKEILSFLSTCNNTDYFAGTLEKGSMDRESVGWAAFEVVRSLDKKIKYLYHMPAKNIRVLRGWRGYVEYTDSGGKTYYLPFGEKVLSPSRKALDGTSEPYDPILDGDIFKAQWNLKSKKNLNKSSSLKDSANEVLFLPKAHPKSLYYGLPDIIPAVGCILANINIRDFFLQFFDHNCVPQYAIIVKGASLSDDVKKAIQQFFERDVKGNAHKTLVIPIPSNLAEQVEVIFERLSTDTKEGSFQDTRKNNWTEIIIAHGTTPAVVGLVESANLGSGKGNSQQINYKTRVVDPMQRYWENALNMLFRRGLGVTSVRLRFENLDASDLGAEATRLERYNKIGALSINEVRKLAKLGRPVDGGGRPFIIVHHMIVFIDELEKVAGDMGGADAKKMVEVVGELSNMIEEARRE